jgi:formate dehydrogenase assembly factor FdhD
MLLIWLTGSTAGVDLSGCALITSGRLSGLMVAAKAARSGFPVLVSRSAPVNSGVELARKIGMMQGASFHQQPRHKKNYKPDAK